MASGIRIVIILVTLASVNLVSAAQNQPLAFDVASVKPRVITVGGFIGMRISGSLVTVSMSTLKRFIVNAYKVQDYQVLGGPAWVDDYSLVYDISAPGDRTPTLDETREMLQTLLADRFKLVIHHEVRVVSGYALVIGKGGSKLKPTAAIPPVRGCLWAGHA
jgi:uncharacterized protein (TIGR03435 family)